MAKPPKLAPMWAAAPVVGVELLAEPEAVEAPLAVLLPVTVEVLRELGTVMEPVGLMAVALA